MNQWRLIELSTAVQRAYHVSLTMGSKLNDQILWMDGYTSPLQRGFLNILCEPKPIATYLEIGVFQGASLIAAAFNNSGTFVGVDNFVEGTRNVAFNNCRNYCGSNTIQLIEADIWKMDLSTLPLPDVLFFDANTSDNASSSILERLTLPMEFIVIVDNWSYKAVRHNFYSTIARLDWTIFAGYQLLSPNDCDLAGFGSGWYVAVIGRVPMRSTTPETMVPIREGAVPLWALKKRRWAGLMSIADYADKKVK